MDTTKNKHCEKCGRTAGEEIVFHACGKGWSNDKTIQALEMEAWLEENPGKSGLDYSRLVLGGSGR